MNSTNIRPSNRYKEMETKQTQKEKQETVH